MIAFFFRLSILPSIHSFVLSFSFSHHAIFFFNPSLHAPPFHHSSSVGIRLIERVLVWQCDSRICVARHAALSIFPPSCLLSFTVSLLPFCRSDSSSSPLALSSCKWGLVCVFALLRVSYSVCYPSPPAFGYRLHSPSWSQDPLFLRWSPVMPAFTEMPPLFSDMSKDRNSFPAEMFMSAWDNAISSVCSLHGSDVALYLFRTSSLSLSIFLGICHISGYFHTHRFCSLYEVNPGVFFYSNHTQRQNNKSEISPDLVCFWVNSSEVQNLNQVKLQKVNKTFHEFYFFFFP